MDYYEKYLKYKNKYLQLKQSGGLMNVISTDPSLNRTMTLQEYFNEAISKKLFDSVDIPPNVNDVHLASFLYTVSNTNFCNIDTAKQLFNRHFDFNYSDLNIQKYSSKYYNVDDDKKILSATNKIKIKNDDVDINGGVIHIEKKTWEENPKDCIIYKLALYDSNDKMIKNYNYKTLEEAFNKFINTTYNFECKSCKTFTSDGLNLQSFCKFDFNNIKNLLIEPSDTVIELTRNCVYIQNKNIIIYERTIYAGKLIYDNNQLKTIIIYPQINFLVPKQNYSDSLKTLFENTSSLLTNYNTLDISFNKFLQSNSQGFENKQVKDRINNIELLPFNFYHLHLIKVNNEPRDFLFVVHGKYEDYLFGTPDEIWTYDGKKIFKKDISNINPNIIKRIHNYFIHIKLNDAGGIIFKKLYILNISNINKLDEFFSANISFKYTLFGDPIYAFNYIDNKENVLVINENRTIDERIGVNDTDSAIIGLTKKKEESPVDIVSKQVQDMGITREQIENVYAIQPHLFKDINKNLDRIIGLVYS